MNRERMEELAERLESGDMPEGFRFDMGRVLETDGCNSAGCVAGLTLVIWGGDHSDDAANILGLPKEIARDLFFPAERGDRRFNYDPYNSTPAQAAAAIRRMLAGEAPWPEDPVDA